MSKSISYIEQKLPGRLVSELYRLAQKYKGKGIRLFIFGSFARPDNRKTSDLDVGVLWDEGRSQKVFSQLYRDIQELPTVRKIDLVDMEEVDESFKRRALEEAVFLTDEKETV